MAKYTFTAEGKLSSDGSAGGWSYPAIYHVTDENGNSASYYAYDGNETALAKKVAADNKLVIAASDGKSAIADKLNKKFSPDYATPARGVTGTTTTNRVVLGDVLVVHTVLKTADKTFKVGRYYVKK